MQMPAAVEADGGNEGQSESQLAVSEIAPALASGPYQASGWATLAETQKKC